MFGVTVTHDKCAVCPNIMGGFAIIHSTVNKQTTLNLFFRYTNLMKKTWMWIIRVQSAAMRTEKGCQWDQTSLNVSITYFYDSIKNCIIRGRNGLPFAITCVQPSRFLIGSVILNCLVFCFVLCIFALLTQTFHNYTTLDYHFHCSGI
jgi:hypothetical protein